MQELERDLSQDLIQATLDVCLHLTYFKNLTQNKLGPLQIVISVVSEDLAIAVPYQIISNKTYHNSSKIDLQTYSSSFYVLQPLENSIIDEMVIFKIHVPIDQVETGNIKLTIGLETINQLAFDNEDSRKRLSQIQLNFNSILYIDSFLPCFFDLYGISLQGNIYTHLLGCQYRNFKNIYRHHFYQAIDHLVISYNKLRQKTASIKKDGQSDANQSSDVFENLPPFIEMKNYEHYENIKNFIQKRIFQEHSMKEHRETLQKFVAKFIPQMTQRLLLLWKLYLKFVNFSLTDQTKRDFYEKLTIQFKKRVEYRVQKPLLSKSEIYNKRQNFEVSLPQYKSNINKNGFNQIYLFAEDQIAENDLKQRFHQKDVCQKKLYISNLELNYPSIKVKLSKSIQIKHKKDPEMIAQPHLVVFVHGLGATSNAFTEFENLLKNMYWKNVFILNSTCNQNFVDEQMEEMGRKLSLEVTQFILRNNFGQNFQLSFIGHSLGGLIIRAALPRLQVFKQNMKTLITLSTPHLGYFYHNSTLNKAGMWAISKFSNNQIINNLLMSDSNGTKIDQETGYRRSYLYCLSTNQGMEWFEHVMFCGSLDDYFVSPISAFATTREQITMKKDLKSKIWQEMRTNIESKIENSNVYRLLVEFGEKSQTSIKDQIIGKASHIMYLSSKDFITYLLLAYQEFFI